MGAGNIGSALFSYKEFGRQGFDFAGIFDVSADRVGQRWRDLTILHVDRLKLEVERLGLEIGVIAVPARAAQSVADRMVHAGIRGILNFAHRKLSVPREVALRNVNLAVELESLSFSIKAPTPRPARGGRRRSAPR